jgi:hypothetical protein
MTNYLRKEIRILMAVRGTKIEREIKIAVKFMLYSKFYHNSCYLVIRTEMEVKG